MRMHFPSTVALASLALALSAPVSQAQEEHRQLGAHVHGHGTLDLAVEDQRMSLELEVPGMDIVGFEHAAQSDEQKAAVANATSLLQRPLDIFVLPAAAGCRVASAEVALQPEHEHDDDDAGHDHAAHEGAGDHDHDGHAGHNQFHATYSIDCADPAALTAITFNYFKLFAGAQALTVNVATAKGQSKYEVSRDKPTLDLAGVM